LKRAEVIIDSLRVDEVRNYVYNGLGNIFNVLEKYATYTNGLSDGDSSLPGAEWNPM